MPSVVCFGYVAVVLAAFVAFFVGLVVYGMGLAFGKKVSTGKAWSRSLPLIVLPIGVVAALIVGCVAFWVLGDALMSSFYPPSPRQEPSKLDLVGVWQLTQGSLESIKNDGYVVSTHTIELRADGTFVMTNLPDSVWNFGEVGGRFDSGSGQWRIKKDVNRDWSIEFHFTELNGNADDFLTFFYLYGEEPPYRIYDYIGDADSGRILQINKRGLGDYYQALDEIAWWLAKAVCQAGWEPLGDMEFRKLEDDEVTNT